MSSSSAPLVLVPSSINIDETFAVPHIVRPGEVSAASLFPCPPFGPLAHFCSLLSSSRRQSPPSTSLLDLVVRVQTCQQLSDCQA